MASATINASASVKRKIEEKWKNSVRPKLAETIKDDCNEYVRYWSGALSASAHTVYDGHYIRWSTAYAKRVYYTGTPRRAINPKASLRWCEVAKRQYASKWAQKATELFRG